MIAANEAVARELQREAAPCLYRVHERPRAASVERLVEQLASLGVATPAVRAQMSPAQAAELVGGGLAPGGGPRAAHDRPRARRRRGGGAHGRQAGADRAGAALAAAGLLLPPQPRPRRAGVGVLLPLHLPDPPLPRPRVPPGAARDAGRARARPARGDPGGAGRVDLAARARSDAAGARRRRRGALLRAGAPTAGAWPGADLPRRGRRPDRSGRVRRVRPPRGGGERQAATATRGCCR